MTWRGIPGTACIVALVFTGFWSESFHAQSEMVIQRDGTKAYHRPGCDLCERCVAYWR